MMAHHETSMSLPPRWGDDSLSSFLDMAYKNVLATFVRKRRGHGVDLLIRIDQSFLRVGENLVNPSDTLGAVLLLRSHSAFRAACSLSMSGQVTEAFPVLRACLEYSLYALHINRQPDLGEPAVQGPCGPARDRRVAEGPTRTRAQARDMRPRQRRPPTVQQRHR